MCGRFHLDTPIAEIARVFGLPDVSHLPGLTPRYNIAPTQLVSVVRERDGVRELATLRWGLVPHWAKDEGIGIKTINARSETAHEKPAYRQAFERRRCLIPASGFYEWKKTDAGKQPMCARMVDDSVFGMAGLWESWRPPGDDAPLLETCTILTCAANDLLRPIHERMPVILPPESFAAWLDESARDTAALKALMAPPPDECLRVYPVGRRVNNVRHDGPDLIEPIDPPPESLFG